MSTPPIPLQPPVPGFDVVEIVQEASERAGIEFRSGYALETARRSLQLLQLEWANRGLNLWCVDQVPVELQLNVKDYELPRDTVDVLDASFVTRMYSSQSNRTTEYPLERYGMGDWHAITNPWEPGRPSGFFVYRKTAGPWLSVHPVPSQYLDYSTGYGSVRCWRLRQMSPVPRGGTASLDLPLRFVPAMIAGLAYMLSMKSKDAAATSRAPALKQIYEEAFELASQEDRDRANFHFVPANYRC